jgi:tetratricopeptide (TPR) repeat protein
MLMKTSISSSILCLSLLSFWPAIAQKPAPENPDVVAARKARDRASVKDLQQLVESVQRQATATNKFEAYARLALFEMWLCEAIETHHDDTLFKKAAEDGVAAAEKAVALDPKSSDAHWLLGDLLNQLIPHVFGGGMRYGQRATNELDRAIELDPKNANAYVSRAISFYYTPESFGGSRTRAFELLKKAVNSDPAADSPHIWLALFQLDAGNKQEALREIKLALQANSERSFSQFVYGEVKAANEKGAKDSPERK